MTKECRQKGKRNSDLTQTRPLSHSKSSEDPRELTRTFKMPDQCKNAAGKKVIARTSDLWGGQIEREIEKLVQGSEFDTEEKEELVTE